MNIINLETRMPEGDGVKHISLKEWEAEGKKLFGEDKLNWKFVCPNCGNVQTPEEFRKFKDKGAEPSHAYFNCIGRFMDDCKGTLGNKISPCNYTQCGLFILSQIIVTDEKGEPHKVFEFAKNEKE